MTRAIRRRELVTALGGAVVAWPLTARAQRQRLIGMLTNRAEGDAEGRERNTAFRQALLELGWSERSNIRIETRWCADDPDLERRYAEELVTLAPDVVLVGGSLSVEVMQRVARTTPVVFASVIDSVGAGFVGSLAHPGGNVTGFADFEYSLGAKWLEALKQIAPGVTRVAVLRNPSVSSGVALFVAVQATAPSFGVDIIPLDVRDIGEIEHAVAEFARSANAGLIVTPSGLVSLHRDLIVTLAARYKLPAVYRDRSFVSDGGLMSYGPDAIDEYRRAAGYVDRILHGEKPADLPVQAPSKYELAINLRAARAIDLRVPQSLLARADEVIE
jgi:putative ABC transport system substrate-binding protein